jgi:hypothetical protein
MGEMTPDLGRDGQSGALNERKFELECVDGPGYRPAARSAHIGISAISRPCTTHPTISKDI